MRRDLYVTYSPGTPEETLTLKTSWLTMFIGHTSFTIRPTIRTKSVDVVMRPQLHLPHLKHECRHAKQQEGQSRIGWLFRYVTRPSFRREMEEDARKAESAAYPAIRL